MKTTMRLCGVAMVTLLLPACATVTRGTKETYVIESSPPNVDVALSTGQTCTTPCRLKLKRKHDFTATFSKEGYQPLKASVRSILATGGGVAMAGNLLLGGIVGGVVDGTNGSTQSLTPNPLSVTLTPLGRAAAPAPAAPAAAATAPVPVAPVSAPAPVAAASATGNE